MLIYLLPLLAPAVLLMAAGLLQTRRDISCRNGARFADGATVFALLVALASLAVLIITGSGTSPTVGFAGIGVSTRLDAVSVTMLLLISFIGWIVARYARTYLDGEARQTDFSIWLMMTLAAVLLLVQSGNVVQFVGAWIATSLCLHRLLLFYPERIGAQRAACKKFVTARIGDAALIVAALLLIAAYDTTQIAAIMAAAREGYGGGLAISAAVLLSITAILKSAQFPTHGWLTEVMETPTPVSALLHAGVVNGGGFLLIRFADVVLLAPLVLAALVAIGGFTALFAGVVMLTQPAVKTSLAWSTIAQMGFMILQCGLALFPLALLHLVAHSLYKAHAFLSAGDAVTRINAIRKPGPVAIPNMAAVVRAFGMAILIYAIISAVSSYLFGFAAQSPQAIALGAILIFGVAYLIAQGLADAAPRELTRRTAIMSIGATVAYVLLQRGALWLTEGTLPPTPAAGALEWALILLALASFGLVALAQATLPLWSHHPSTQGLRVHFANGLYINAVEDRLLRGWLVKLPGNRATS